VIELSVIAAKALGMMQAGVVLVFLDR